MAADPLRLVEQAYRAWNEGGARAFAEFTSEDVELHDAPELPDSQTWRGRAAMVSRLDDLVAATEGRWADVDDVRPLGEAVLVSLTWRFEQHGTATLGSVYHVVNLEGDRIVRLRVFLDESQATSA